MNHGGNRSLRNRVGLLMGVSAASTAAAQTAITIDSSFGRTPQPGRGGLRPLSTGLVRPDTSLPFLPELPALSLRLTSQAPSTAKCGH